MLYKIINISTKLAKLKECHINLKAYYSLKDQ